MTKVFHAFFAGANSVLIPKVIRNFRIFVALAVIIFPPLILNNYIDTDITLAIFSGSTNQNIDDSSEDITNVVIVKKGDHLASILKGQGLSSKEINNITQLQSAKEISSKLKIGQEISLRYNTSLVEDENDDLTKEQKILNRITIAINPSKTVEFVREGDDFTSHYISSPLSKLITKYETTVDSNVTSSLKKAGLSSNSISKLINAYSHQLDFQRQIHAGDKITVISEKFVNSEGKFSHHGRIIHSAIETKNGNYSIYHYSPNGTNSNYEFFSEEGQTIRSTLLRTPVNVARISSHYGYRSKHPVLGYGAMHRGVDFAAPNGTPIKSAGDGTVSFIGWKAGYGKFIVIKHNNSLSTAYAHASKFSANLQRGSRVKQGDVIAYVGSTGQTTGAHLHYEVILNGKQVNPTEFKSSPGIKLAGDQLRKFHKFKKQIKQLGVKLNGAVEVAESELSEVKL